MDALDFALIAGATARTTRLVTTDAISEGLRTKVVLHFGDGSNADTLVHCPWCASMWAGALVMLGRHFLPPSLFKAGAAVLTASHLTGLIAQHLEDE